MGLQNSVVVQHADKTSVRLRQRDAKAIIAAGMQLPKYASLNFKELAECELLVLRYEVTPDGRAAEMGNALETLSTSPDLLAVGFRDMTLSIVSVIAENPEYFCSATLGGFVIQWMGQPVLFLKNATVFQKHLQHQPALDQIRIGVMDIAEIRRHAIHQYEREKGGQGFWMTSAAVHGVVSFVSAMLGLATGVAICNFCAKMNLFGGDGR